MKSKQEILEYYRKGNRFFRNVDFDNGENYKSIDFQDAFFENCYFGVDFSNSNFTNSKFTECNLKSTNFTNCNFTNAEIINSTVESINFKNSNILNLIFDNNTCYGTEVFLNPHTLECEAIAQPLVKELYQKVPDFEKMTNHLDDDKLYEVFENFSLKLSERIIEVCEPDKMIIDSFHFFNYLGEKNDNEINNLLIIGIYETLYPNKKCNDIARKLLKGKNKEIYEHWMINGNIRAEY